MIVKETKLMDYTEANKIAKELMCVDVKDWEFRVVEYAYDTAKWEIEIYDEKQRFVSYWTDSIEESESVLLNPIY